MFCRTSLGIRRDTSPAITHGNVGTKGTRCKCPERGLSAPSHHLISFKIFEFEHVFQYAPWCQILNLNFIESIITVCGDQILTLVNIVRHVSPHQKYLKRTTNSTYQLDHCGSEEKASDLTLSSPSTRGLSRPEIPSLTSELSAPLRSSLSAIVHPDIQLEQNHPLVENPDPHSKALRRDSPPPR